MRGYLLAVLIPGALHGQSQGCDQLTKEFGNTNAKKELSLKYDEVTDTRTIASKGPGAMGSVLWEVVIVGTAQGKTGQPQRYDLRYARTQVYQAGDAALRPLHSDKTQLSVLADPVRFSLVPSSYRIANDPPFGGLPGYHKETMLFPLSVDQLAALARAQKVKAKADGEDVHVDAGKLRKGARAISTALACQRPI